MNEEEKLLAKESIKSKIESGELSREEVLRKINDKIKEKELEEIEELKRRMENATFEVGYIQGTIMPGRENYRVITIADNYIFRNNTNKMSHEEDETKINLLKELLDSEIANLTDFCSRQTRYTKDSSRDEIHIKYNDQKYLLSGKASDKEIVDYYDELVSKFLKIIG